PRGAGRVPSLRRGGGRKSGAGAPLLPPADLNVVTGQLVQVRRTGGTRGVQYMPACGVWTAGKSTAPGRVGPPHAMPCVPPPPDGVKWKGGSSPPPDPAWLT